MDFYVKDFLGKHIQQGDTIVYPGRASSALWMNKATVLEVLVSGKVVARTNEGKRVTLSNTKNIVVVEVE
jgi:glutamate synthase domain-containing protein 3